MYYEVIYKMAKERGISIKSLEEAAGLGNGAIGKWRTLKPNMASLEKVAKVLGVKVIDIVSASEATED